MEAGTRVDGGTYLWVHATVLGTGGVALLFLLLVMPAGNLVQRAILAFVVALCFAGFAAALYALHRMGREPPPAGLATFACKHCGKPFSDRRTWRAHERTCVEMRL